MKLVFYCALLSFSILLEPPVLAAGAPVKPLITHDGVSVASDDFEAYIGKIPIEQRTEFRASWDRVSKTVDALFINRELAAEARKLGLDKDPLLKLRVMQFEESILSQLMLSRIEETAKIPDLGVRVRELYLADAQRFVEPETVELQHILIGLNGRTREMALARARDVHARALAGENFLALAKEFSDDPGFKINKGNLGAVARKDLEPEIANAAFALKNAGDISEPIATGSGYHLVKLGKRNAGKKIKFEDVKEALIEDETARLRKKAVDGKLQSIKGNSENKVYLEKIRALMGEFDTKLLEKAQHEALKKLEKAEE